jgi:hypothetical protein
MEASALLANLLLADQFGAHSLVLEFDSMEVAIAIAVHNTSEYRGAGAVITDDCRQLLIAPGMAMSQHYPREANGARHGDNRAHSLACHGTSTGCDRVLVG